MKWWRRKPRACGLVESPAEAEARFGSENSVEQVCAALRDGDRVVRADAARKLARLGDPAAIRPLCEALRRELNHGFGNYRFGQYAAGEMIEALAEIGGSEVEDFLCSSLTQVQYWWPIPVEIHDEPDVVPVTEWVAPAMVDTSGVDLLLRGLLDALADDRSTIREFAAGALDNIAYRYMRADDDDDGYVTLFDEGVLTDLNRESMFGALRSALADVSARVRESAVAALGHLGNPNALDGMIALLDDRDGRVRYFAAQALGDLGDSRAVEPLRSHVDDALSAVAVREALARLTRR